ncbi:hypothetical protein [Halocatena halophila]|uniref:hypothetical protein n=1 Tax=Halocatena halophila TaxID=2814576 RepID=UPI002ED0290E
MSFELALSAVRPTQLYLSREKLVGVLEWFDVGAPAYDPLTVISIEDTWYLIDGHTRAFVAFLAGEQTLRLVHDETIYDDPAFPVYRQCIEWCRAARIETIGDLSGCLVDHQTYERKWIERCRAVTTEETQ